MSAMGGKRTQACQSFGSKRDLLPDHPQEFAMFSIILGLVLAAEEPNQQASSPRWP